MRIISGSHKGRILKVPSGLPVRPTTDYAKTGLFNILNNKIDLDRIKVLDLFCGTGNISFEFASRGASQITSVDSHSRCVQFVNSEALKLGLNAITALRADVFKFIKNPGGVYDIVFADPPYESSGYVELHNNLINNGFFSNDGLLIIEHDKRISFKDAPLFKEERNYGNVYFSFFEKG